MPKVTDQGNISAGQTAAFLAPLSAFRSVNQTIKVSTAVSLVISEGLRPYLGV